jgi:predicted ATP-grasp superfamily ATP-dependent carboligase
MSALRSSHPRPRAPRGPRSGPEAGLDLDLAVPVLFVRIGNYPLHHGTVGAIRSLGRLGVPVYAITEGRRTPAALSRYLTSRCVWPTSGSEPREQLLAGLRRIGGRIADRAGTPVAVVATDDEAAAALAEDREQLADVFRLPPVEPGLPGRLADKQGLFELCREHGIPAPGTVMVDSPAGLREAVARFGLPVVVKNAAPWSRLASPVVGGTTVLRGPDQVLALAAALERSAGGRLIVQEFLRPQGGAPRRAPDWFAHVYCPADGGEPLVFTGLKLHGWPPGGGVTARGVALPNPSLARAAAHVCRSFGYRGIGDMDWRYDPRDGRLKLVDFNPRLGAQAQVFRTGAGVDLVRALHLDLTGRRIPAGRQVDGRELIVEHLDAAARVAGLLRRGRPGEPRLAAVHREPAWFAWDDPVPFAAATARFGALALRRLAR